MLAILLCASDVLAGTGINANLFAGVDEQGNVDNGARFEGGGFGDVVRGIATHTWLGTHYLDFYEVGQFGGDDGFAIDQQLYRVLLFQELDGLTKQLFGNRLLIVGFRVHENIIITINVQELPSLVFYTNLFYVFTGAETLLDDTTAFEVFQICAYKGTPVSRTDMMEFSYGVQFIIVAYDHAVTKFGGCSITQWSILST